MMRLLPIVFLAACASGRANPPASQRPAPAPQDSARPRSQTGVQPYGRAIEGTTPKNGIFRVHSGGDRVLYEIPRAQLGKPFLWVTQIAKAQEGSGFGGTAVTDRVVHWEQRGDRVLLREESFGIVAPDSIPASWGVDAATFPRVLKSFRVASFGPDSAPVIDATELFTREVFELSPRNRLGQVRRLDPDRSFLERTAVFPENIETEATLTFELNNNTDVSVLVHHSMVKLPDDPMQPRIADRRVGFFTVAHRDYSKPDAVEENTSYSVRYITRWRLEKKDPNAAVSEPVKPIVYYLGREIPDRYRPYIKAGIESWQPAFEKAGFRNAIIARDAPSVAEDPDWSAEDARISSVRWQPTDDTNAMGPHVHDPRTGEILEADIIMHGGLLDRYRAMFVAQVGADLGVKGGQVADSIEHEILRSVIAHEVGHTLGLQHNMSASDAYPVDSLRSGSFTRKYSVSPSIMDYTRFNYVAQPGDDAIRVRILGPYDDFAIKWGYQPIPSARSAEAEVPTLNQWAAGTATDKTIAFSADRYNARVLTEDLGDDPVKATEYGLKNIARSFEALKEAMAVPGDNFDNLQYMYGQLLDQRDRMFNHVARLIGGSYWESRTYGQEGTTYHPVPEAEQKRAVEYLAKTALRAPSELSDPATLRMFDPFGGAQEVMTRQARLVATLLNPQRLAEMSMLQATAGPRESVLGHTEYLRQLRGLVFSELSSGSVRVDAWRRNIQRAYVERAARAVADTATNGEARAALRAELEAVRSLAQNAQPRTADPATRAHVAWLRSQAEMALEPAGD